MFKPITLATVPGNTTLASFRSDPNSTLRDIAGEAYEDAVTYLRRELRGDEGALTLLNSTSSMIDFKRAVENARVSYESQHPKSKCIKVLRKLSSRIMYYSQVLDILAEHHPKYVSLAWGSVRLVLVGIISHEKMLAHFSTALVDIGDALAKADLGAQLHKTDRMRDAVAHLYAHIMLFSQQAVRWYSRSRISRAVEAILHPVELDYQDTVQQIKSYAHTVNDIANAHTRVEIRDLHVLLQVKLPQLEEKLKQMQQSLEEKTMANLHVARRTNSIADGISVSVADIQPRIHDLQFASILSALAPRYSPHSALAKLNSITKRASAHSIHFKDSPSTPNLMSSLQTWVSAPGSALFVVRVGLRAEMKSKAFTADIINFLKQQQFIVFFIISQESNPEDLSITSILKSLIYQALKLCPDILTSDPSQLNVGKFAAEHTESEWRSLLFNIFSKITNCFILIEAQVLIQVHRDDLEWITRFMLLWEELIDQATSNGKAIKILIASNSNDGLGETGSRSATHNRVTAVIEAPGPIPPRLRKTLGPRARANQLREFRRLNPRF